MTKPKVLLLSAYDAQSHRQWRTTLVQQFAGYDWTVLTLPPRHFSWRVRGNALTWYASQTDKFQLQYDLIIATSMVDLASLKGLYPQLTNVPSLLYFHENQFAYPESTQTQSLLEAQITSIYSACAASKLLFNSRFNLQSFFTGAEALLRKLPDKGLSSIVHGLSQKADVLPVPIDVTASDLKKDESASLAVVWNHRWEFDKGPERLLAVIESLPEDAPIVFHILGQQFRSQPPAFSQIESLLRHRGQLGRFGYVADRADYISLLAASDIVLSTAKHDFQGLSVLEAVSLGCIPVLPADQVYPEIFAAQHCYAKDRPDEAAKQLQVYSRIKRTRNWPAAPSVAQFQLANLMPRYQAVLQSML